MSRCKAKTKRGTRCKATPRHDTGLCNAHSPKEVRESTGFGGAQKGAGRPRVGKPTDVLRERVESDVDKWLAPFEDALQATRAVVVGNGPSAYVELVPDYGKRMKAATEVLDRVYGRPIQAHDVNVESETIGQSDFDREVAALVETMRKRDAGRSRNGVG